MAVRLCTSCTAVQETGWGGGGGGCKADTVSLLEKLVGQVRVGGIEVGG